MAIYFFVVLLGIAMMSCCGVYILKRRNLFQLKVVVAAAASSLLLSFCFPFVLGMFMNVAGGSISFGVLLLAVALLFISTGVAAAFISANLQGEGRLTFSDVQKLNRELLNKVVASWKAHFNSSSGDMMLSSSLCAVQGPQHCDMNEEQTLPGMNATVSNHNAAKEENNTIATIGETVESALNPDVGQTQDQSAEQEGKIILEKSVDSQENLDTIGVETLNNEDNICQVDNSQENSIQKDTNSIEITKIVNELEAGEQNGNCGDLAAHEVLTADPAMDIGENRLNHTCDQDEFDMENDYFDESPFDIECKIIDSMASNVSVILDNDKFDTLQTSSAVVELDKKEISGLKENLFKEEKGLCVEELQEEGSLLSGHTVLLMEDDREEEPCKGLSEESISEDIGDIEPEKESDRDVSEENPIEHEEALEYQINMQDCDIDTVSEGVDSRQDALQIEDSLSSQIDSQIIENIQASSDEISKDDVNSKEHERSPDGDDDEVRTQEKDIEDLLNVCQEEVQLGMLHVDSIVIEPEEFEELPVKEQLFNFNSQNDAENVIENTIYENSININFSQSIEVENEESAQDLNVDMLGVEELIDEAFRLKQNGSYMEAVHYYMGALDKNPEKDLVFWVILDICVLYKEMGQVELARNILEGYIDVYGDVMNEDIKTEITRNLI